MSRARTLLTDLDDAGIITALTILANERATTSSPDDRDACLVLADEALDEWNRRHRG